MPVRILVFNVLMVVSFTAFSQKEVYIPQEWQQPGGLDYSLSRSAQSDNFIVFWGPLAGDDPQMAPPEIAFDPQAILDTAEDLYHFYIDSLQFIHDDTGVIHQYKIILVLLNTWTGLEGWAFGGSYDATVGAMWMHPHAASSGPTLAHEFTHTLQNYAWIMNPGHSFIDSSYVGFFWETHAEFMALQRYPSVALEFDMARWLNTCQFHWSSTRHHYQAFVFLQMIKETDGIQMINRMWNEASIGEHPLQTYRRLKGIGQEELNDLFAAYAMRNVTWDYEIGDLLRERVATLDPVFVSHQTIIPEAVNDSIGWYRIQNHLAPQDYGYNIIRLYPDTLMGCDKRVVYIHVTRQIIIPGNDQAGIRFGLVAVNTNGAPRYSEIYHSDQEFAFEMMPDEDQLYLVVTGAPPFHHNYAWENGFPKTYRFPYEFRLKHAKPEGYQKGFRAPDPGIPGAPHINGGGFVAATASVDLSAYVGPDAQVLDNAVVMGNARIEDHAIIKHNARVDENAVIKGQAVIGQDAHIHGDAVVGEQAHVFGGCDIDDQSKIGGNSLIFYSKVYDDAFLKDNTFCWGAELHGDITLGGDAEFFSECSAGTYLQFEGAYGRHCDGLDNHPANTELIQFFFPYQTLYNLQSATCDGVKDNIFDNEYFFLCQGDTVTYNGIPFTEGGEYFYESQTQEGIDSVVIIQVDVGAPLDVYVKGGDHLCMGDTLWLFGVPVTDTSIHTLFVDTFQCGLYVHFNLQYDQPDTSLLVNGQSLTIVEQAVLVQWYDCDTGLPIDGAVNATFTPAENGTYQAKIITLNGCLAWTSCYTVTTVNTGDLLTAHGWNVYPNPSNADLFISTKDKTVVPVSWQLFDHTGKRLDSVQSERTSSGIRFFTGALPDGVYSVWLTDNAGTTGVCSFIIAH